jgi:hypothetical protein
MSATNRTLLTLSGFALIAGASINIYSNITIDKHQENLREITRQLFVENGQAKLSVELRKENQLFRIKYPARQGQTTTIFVNGNELSANTWPFRRFKKNFQTDYIFVPKRLLKEGRNLIKLSFGSAVSRADVVIRNYRKFLRPGIYVFFCRDSLRSRLQFIASILIMVLGMTFFLLGQDVILKKDRMFLYRRRYSLSGLIILLSVILGGSRFLGLELRLTPVLFCCSAFLVSAAFVLMDMFLMPQYTHPVLLKASGFLFTRKRATFRTCLILTLIIITVDLWAYWPSFFHVFRHDEWFLFFSSKGETPDLQFLIKHVDWQLRLPYDRLIFRPISWAFVALNRVVFDDNYIGPHILTFAKHILATLCLWWLMWQLNPRWISWLFALLFSVLVVSVDPVTYPHFDAYMTTTVFTILALTTFHKTISNQVHPFKGFALTGLLLLLGMLTTELGFLVPAFLFLAYWLLFRNRSEARVKSKDRAICLVMLLPTVLWAVLFAIHLYLAYPDLGMGVQSAIIGWWKPLWNMGRFALILLLGMFLPVLTGMHYADKVYLTAFDTRLVFLILLIPAVIAIRQRVFKSFKKEMILMPAILLLVLMVICFSRAPYVSGMLNGHKVATHYSYCASALLVCAIYALLDFDRISTKTQQKLFISVILTVLIASHAVKTHACVRTVQMLTTPLKKYFDSVKAFVSAHKNEPDFSFKIIDRPPKIGIFAWYYETCVDGLFNRFIHNNKPKYLLEYDYAAERLKCSSYSETCRPVEMPEARVDASPDADYVNSIGMQFKRVSARANDFLMGAYEVTQKQWRDVMGFNPSRFRNDNHPVENVSYQTVQEFVRRLNKTEGDGFYRLPTVEEYSYLVNISPLSQAPSNIKEHAWLKHNSQGTTNPVGSLSSLIGGFHDLIGNVWEWTGNPIYYMSFIEPLPDNPRLCFGGSWRDDDIDMDSLMTNYPLDFQHEHLGFRLVREIGSSVKKEP